MYRKLVIVFIIGMLHNALANECIPPGVEPERCNSECQLPDCACEESEPDVPLAERPQVI